MQARLFFSFYLVETIDILGLNQRLGIFRLQMNQDAYDDDHGNEVLQYIKNTVRLPVLQSYLPSKATYF